SFGILEPEKFSSALRRNERGITGYDSNKEKIIEVAGHIIDKIDQKRILEYFGSKENISCDAEKIKKDMTRKRSHLVDALLAKGLAIADLVLEKSDSDTIPSSLLKLISSENVGNANIDRLDENRSKLAFIRGTSDDEDADTFEKRANSSCSGIQSASKDCIESSISSVPKQSDLSKTDEKELLATLGAKTTPDFADSNGLSSLEEPTVPIDSSTNYPCGNDSARIYTTEDLNKTFVDLAKFCDMNDPKVFMFCVKCAIAHQHYGRALKYLKNGLSDKSTKERYILFIEMNLLNPKIVNAVSRRFTPFVSRRNCASSLPDKVEEDKTLDDDYDVNGQLIQKKAELTSSDTRTETVTHATERSLKPKSSSLNLMSLLEKGAVAETSPWYNNSSSVKLTSLLDKSAYENLDDNAPFEDFLRHSKFVQLGDPLGRIVVGKIAHVHKDNLYIDFGGKFNCVCKKPLFNPE
uniref:Uncharacterized protein n=1 Tax=Romanomermis culicivorax TaxID=13658 RepID=A0A915HS92_ROMCU